jgi:transcriptional regulator with XRE-family HTH domain
MSFGERLKHYRLLHNMKQSDLGKTLNVTAQTVSKWENNLSEPDFQSIEKITEVFQVSYDQLFHENSRLAYQGILLEVNKDHRMKGIYSFFTLFLSFLFFSLITIVLYLTQVSSLPNVFPISFIVLVVLDFLALVLMAKRREEFLRSPNLLMTVYQDHIEILKNKDFVFCKEITKIVKRTYPVYENIGSIKIKTKNQVFSIRNIDELNTVYEKLTTLVYTIKKGGNE